MRAIAVSPDGQLLATAGDDRKVKVWRFADGQLVKEFSGHDRHVYHVVFHPDGKQLLSGDITAKFFHWTLDADAPVRQFAIASLSKFDAGFMADYGGPHCMTITPDGKRVLAGGITNVTNAFAGIGNPIIVAIDWDAGKDAVTHLTKGKVNATAWGVVMHAEGFVIGGSAARPAGISTSGSLTRQNKSHTLNLGNSARSGIASGWAAWQQRTSRRQRANESDGPETRVNYCGARNGPTGVGGAYTGAALTAGAAYCGAGARYCCTGVAYCRAGGKGLRRSRCVIHRCGGHRARLRNPTCGKNSGLLWLRVGRLCHHRHLSAIAARQFQHRGLIVISMPELL